MSAETLRRAAALIRERADGATSGPWAVSPSSDGQGRNLIYSEEIATRYSTANPTVAVVVSPQHGDTDDAEWGQTDDAAHIAAWHPAVALAVADWLDEAADHIGDFSDVPAEALCPTTRDGFDCSVLGQALAVARAYLGEQP